MNIKLKYTIFILHSALVLGNMYKQNNSAKTRSPIAQQNLEWNIKLEESLKKEGLKHYKQKRQIDSIQKAKEGIPEIIFGTLY